MSIRFRVHLFQLIIGVSVLMVAAEVFVTLRWTDYHLKRVEGANRQLEAILALKVHANRFSEQIAEVLLIGEPELPDFESARVELEAGFDHLEKTTKAEFEFLKESAEQEETYRLERMRTVYREIDESVIHVFALRAEGRQDDAVLIFRREIENRLDVEFESLLTAATLDEKHEVERIQRDAQLLWQKLVWTTAITTLMAVLACLASGTLLARSLVGPIKLLTRGTEAVGRGELDHRIRYDSRDELGMLARRFNEMAAQHEQRRALLLEAQSDLERQVTDRTQDLAAANKRLTDLDRLRVQFLADISHELRTPLTALRGEAEVTLRHGSKPETIYRDTLARIVTQASDMGRLVDDLLFLARSEADTIRFEPRRTVLQDLVIDAVRESEVLGRSKRIALNAEYPSDTVWIEADAQRLKQAFLILLDNAIKYSPPGRSVIMRMTVINGHCEVAVRDQGIGIPAEELPHVFERFYRGRASGTSSRIGIGLGLAIAKWIVEKHGGEIALTSEIGRFTEVRIRIPRAKVALLVKNSVGRG